MQGFRRYAKYFNHYREEILHTVLLPRIRVRLVILTCLDFLSWRWGEGERLLQDISRRAQLLLFPTASVCRRSAFVNAFLLLCMRVIPLTSLEVFLLFCSIGRHRLCLVYMASMGKECSPWGKRPGAAPSSSWLQDGLVAGQSPSGILGMPLWKHV